MTALVRFALAGALAFALAPAPGVLAQTDGPETPPAQQDRLDEEMDKLGESAAKAMEALSGLLGALREKMPEIEERLKENMPEIQRGLDEATPEMEQLMKSLTPLIQSLAPNYEAPETLPNGDIIIRRRPETLQPETETET